MSLAFLFHYLMLNVFRVLIRPFSSYQSNAAHEITRQISRMFLMMDVLTSETR